MVIGFPSAVMHLSVALPGKELSCCFIDMTFVTLLALA